MKNFIFGFASAILFIKVMNALNHGTLTRN